jgi:3-oxoacyl-[acyl-carrier-protein] synthase-3
MVTDAPKILEAGMDLTLKIHQLAIAELNWNTAQFDEFAIHQIGKVHTKMFRKMLGIESRKLMETYPKYGNMGPASLPFVISKLETTGRLVTSKRLAIVGIGSGLNSMMMDIQW